MLHVLWTVTLTILKCPYIPKVFIYTRAVKMFIINLIVRKSSPKDTVTIWTYVTQTLCPQYEIAPFPP